MEAHTPNVQLIVYLDSATDSTCDRPRQSRDQDDRYTPSLEDQVEYLRRQLDRERDANRENPRIIAVLTQRIPELEVPVEGTGEKTEKRPRGPRSYPYPPTPAEGLHRTHSARRSGGGGVGHAGTVPEAARLVVTSATNSVGIWW